MNTIYNTLQDEVRISVVDTMDHLLGGWAAPGGAGGGASLAGYRTRARPPRRRTSTTTPPLAPLWNSAGAFDRQLSEYTREHFGRGGIDVQLGTM